MEHNYCFHIKITQVLLIITPYYLFSKDVSQDFTHWCNNERRIKVGEHKNTHIQLNTYLPQLPSPTQIHTST